MRHLTPFALAGALLCAGCHASSHAVPSSSQDGVLARIGDQVITAKDLQAKIDEEPAFLRARFEKPDGRKQLLDDMVRFQVLVQEARREGLDQDPKLKETFDKLLVQRLIQKQSETPATVTDAELQAYYEAHKAEFVRPEKVRVSQVFLPSAANDPKHKKVEAEAKHLLGQIRAKEAGPVKTAFSEVARTRSDDLRSKGMGGDLGLVTEDQLSTLWGPEVAKAAFGLKTIGEITEVASPRGFHLLKLTARLPGMNRSFESVKPLLQSRVAIEQRAKRVDGFVSDLRKQAKVEIDEKALAAMPAGSKS